MKKVLGFIPIARPTFDVSYAEELTQQVHQNLQNAGYDLRGSIELVMDMTSVENALVELTDQQLDLLVVLQATFADSTMLMRIAEAMDTPLVLWALPEPRIGGRLRLNSFCGINLAGHALSREKYTYEYVYANPTDQVALAKIAVLARAGSAYRQLQSSRIGRIGNHPAGFETCAYDADALASQFGVAVDNIELSSLFNDVTEIQTQHKEAVQALRENVKTTVAGIDDIDATATDGTLSTYLALEKLAEEKDLSGVAVRCWPEFFTEMGCSACGAMSMITNSHIPSSCEADVNGTLTQLILQLLSGEPAFGTDVVSFDVDEDISILWHCGLAPLLMADPDIQPQATIHSNRQMPLLMEFPLKPGRVTVARLSETTGKYRMVIGGGEMLKAPASFTGTTGTLRFDNGAQTVMDAILEHGLEHHVAITYGDYRAELRVLAKFLNIDILEI